MEAGRCGPALGGRKGRGGPRKTARPAGPETGAPSCRPCLGSSLGVPRPPAPPRGQDENDQNGKRRKETWPAWIKPPPSPLQESEASPTTSTTGTPALARLLGLAQLPRWVPLCSPPEPFQTGHVRFFCGSRRFTQQRGPRDPSEELGLSIWRGRIDGFGLARERACKSARAGCSSLPSAVARRTLREASVQN